MKLIYNLSITGFLFVSLTATAQELKIQPYTGIAADYIFLTGSFDGESFFTTDDEIILVPKLQSDFGFGILFGFKMGKGAVDFAYHMSRMEYTSMEDGFSGKSTSHFVRYLSYKRHFNTTEEKRFIPYVDFDLSIAFSHFERISYPLNNQAEIRSANYGGVIFGAGIGSQLYLTEKLTLDFKVLPELYIGTDIRSKNSERYEITKFNNFLLISSIGLNYYFR
jgi:hypothetical protein